MSLKNLKNEVIGKTSGMRTLPANGGGHPRKNLPTPVNGLGVDQAIETITNRMREGIQRNLEIGTFTLEQLMVWYEVDIRGRR